MIEEIWLSVQKYRCEHGRDIALEVRMHPSVFDECKYCPYDQVVSAFNMRLNEQVTEMFGYSLVIDEQLNKDEWLVQPPRINKDNKQ